MITDSRRQTPLVCDTYLAKYFCNLFHFVRKFSWHLYAQCGKRDFICAILIISHVIKSFVSLITSDCDTVGKNVDITKA